MSGGTERLRAFVTDLADVVETAGGEAEILERGRGLLAALVAEDDWLPEDYARPAPDRYTQYLLHCDSKERFSVVSFVWGPGQSTPVHNHTVWGLIGVLRGAEVSQAYEVRPGALVAGPARRLAAGEVEAVSPTIGDVHTVSNAHDDAVSISIHVYGANIGAVERATFDAEGRPKLFISGYANATVPNIWTGPARRPDAARRT